MNKLLLPTKAEILNQWNYAFIHNRKLIPRLPGIYILATKETFLYIGTSKCIRKRIFNLINVHPIGALVPIESRKNLQQIRLHLFWYYGLKVYYQLFDANQDKQRYQAEAALIKQFKPLINDCQYRLAVQLATNQKSA